MPRIGTAQKDHSGSCNGTMKSPDKSFSKVECPGSNHSWPALVDRNFAAALAFALIQANVANSMSQIYLTK